MPRSEFIFEVCKDDHLYGTLPECVREDKLTPKGSKKQMGNFGMVTVFQSQELANVVENSAKVARKDLTSSRSCLALNEIKEIAHTIDGRSMSNKDLSPSFSNRNPDSVLRKDSGTESGFIESEAEFETEITRNVPSSFTSLPPLEQRRQRRIKDLVKLLENFANGFHELIQQMQVIMKKIFSNAIPNKLAIKKANFSKIANSLQQLTDSIIARKVIFTELGSSGDEVEFYIGNFGYLLGTKLEDIFKTFESLENGNLAERRHNNGNNDEYLQRIFNDAVLTIREYFLRLQLSIKYVLYCTPRQHIDHRPLTQLMNDLNRINRRNFDKSSEGSTEKNRSDSLPVETNDGASSKKNATKIKRRYSLDNSALKKLSALSRGLSFGRKSTRLPRQEKVNESTEKQREMHNGITDKQDTRRISSPWHSTPNNRKQQPRIIEHKRSKINEDIETSFDVFKTDNSKDSDMQGDSILERSLNTLEEKRSCSSQNQNSYLCSEKRCVGNYRIENRNNSVGDQKNGKVCDDLREDYSVSAAKVSDNDEDPVRLRGTRRGDHSARTSENNYNQHSRGCDKCNNEWECLTYNTNSFSNSTCHIATARNIRKNDLSHEPHQLSVKNDVDFACKTCDQGNTNDIRCTRKARDQVTETRIHGPANDIHYTNKTHDQLAVVNGFSSGCEASENSAKDDGSYLKKPRDQSILSDKFDKTQSHSGVDDAICIRGCSPTILTTEGVQHHSPTLLNDFGTNYYIDSFDNDRIPSEEVKPKVEKSQAEISQAKPEKLKIKPKLLEVKPDKRQEQPERGRFQYNNDNGFLTVPSVSPDCYTSDEDLRLDRYLGKIYPESQENSFSEKPNKPFNMPLSSAVRTRYQNTDDLPGEKSLQGHNSNYEIRRIDTPKLRMTRGNSNDKQKVKNEISKFKDSQMSKKNFEIPAIEDSSKGIRVTVARAKKKFKEFSSPRISRKKEQNIASFQKKGVLESKKEDIRSICHLKDPSNGASGDNTSYKNIAKNSDKNGDKNGDKTGDKTGDKNVSLYGSKQESSRLCDRSLYSSHEGSPDSNKIGTRHCDGKTSEDEGASAVVNCFHDGFANGRPRSSTTSSVASDLSISSDFQSTITKILRSNSVSSNPPVRIGQSTFYCKTAESSVRMLVGSSEESDGFSSSQSGDVAIKKGSVPFEKQNVTNNQSTESIKEDKPSKESSDKRENEHTTEKKAKPMRTSRSEPVLKNKQSPAKLVTNSSFDSQNVLQRFPKIPQSRILSWSQNFDRLLADKDGVKIFSQFLQSEYSEENICFWLACENLKSLKSNKIGKTAQKIYKTFIEIFSVCEINLDHQTRMRIKESLSSPSRNMFDTAQARIKQLMAQDSYQRFIKSPLYDSLLLD